MFYDINRFHLLAFVTWQFTNYFAGQNIFGIYSNNVPKWKCGDSEPTKDCQVYLSCSKSNLTFVDPPFMSAAIEFDWICGSSALYQSFFNQIQYAGVLVGTLLFGTLSDRFGRKPIGIFVFCLAICATFASGSWIMWFIGAMCGTASDLNSGNLAGDFYLNQLLFGVLLVFSKMLLLFVDTRFTNFKRRTLHQGSLIGIIISFACLTCFRVMDYHGVGVLIVYLIGTVFIEYTWDACYLCAIELMETSSRASATGSCSLAARAGKIVAPILLHANMWWPYAVNTSIIVLGTINLLVSYLLLPESKGVNLDDVHVNDDENAGEQQVMVQKSKE